MPRFRSTKDGYRAAKQSYVCMACGRSHPLGTVAEDPKKRACASGRCGAARLQYCASGREAKRLRELILMQRAGTITGLRCQPRYSCDVNGLHVCTYVADFAYTMAGPHEYGPVIEDVKGDVRHQDTSSAVRRKLAEALHAIVVRLV